MSLQEPTKKMSKSDPNMKASIFLTDTDDEIRNKIRRAVTDSGTEIRYDEQARPGISNLMSLYHIATDKSFADIESEFAGSTGYAPFKEAVGEAVAAYVRPIRERFLELRANEDGLRAVAKHGAEQARYRAGKVLRKVYKKTGFIEL
jgi:tryptophanyl-tRNA synthetase